MAYYPPPSHRDQPPLPGGILDEHDLTDSASNQHWALQGDEPMPLSPASRATKRQRVAMLVAGVVLVAAIVVVVVLPAIGHPIL